MIVLAEVMMEVMMYLLVYDVEDVYNNDNNNSEEAP